MRAARTHSRPRAAIRGARATRVRRALVALGLMGLAVLGCERKAPGPIECAAYAQAFVRVPGDDERLTLALESKIDDVTQLCLTTPYDRQLIACAQSTGRARDCFDAYKRRTRQAP
jgi:hypothetical protein